MNDSYVTKRSFTYSPPKGIWGKKFLAYWFMDLFNTRHVENHHQYIKSPLPSEIQKKWYFGWYVFCLQVLHHSPPGPEGLKHMWFIWLLYAHTIILHNWIICKFYRLLVKWIYDSSAMDYQDESRGWKNEIYSLSKNSLFSPTPALS